MSEKPCRACGRPIRWSNEKTLRALCDECWDARMLAWMRRAEKAMAKVLKASAPDADPKELGEKLVAALKKSLKEEA